jgi:RNA polymerase sigma-70 factor (ECF subfamily)
MSPDEADPETEELMRLSRAGDEAAVQQLLVRHRERLHRMVAVRMDQRLKARFDPSDVIQEAFLDAARKLPAYLQERPLPFYPWLRQMAWDRLVDLHRRHLRAAGRSVVREARWSVSDESIGELARQLVAGGSSPSSRLGRDENRDRVRGALETLSADDRELLLLRHLEQLRVGEIAAVLEISEPAVKSRLRRALERLHNALGSDFGEGWR